MATPAMTPGHPDRRWSGLYELRFKGCPVGHLRELGTAGILARKLGFGSEVREVRDGDWKPFGLSYAPMASEVEGCSHITADEARAAIAKAEGR
ncbi:hypothetical protein [Methylobacterium planeticum]|uniref:Uncharacterized protein n=1 Tax=Methylobacterium planeticum TaxID=2615211 RepID=A0A6N6MGA6_9HYPH|nr:hypothetical protein [Methylobacterium planeticum]KAB1068871.1 hypothetical protein F6X51_26060 [Methylobacterium planeticum]